MSRTIRELKQLQEENARLKKLVASSASTRRSCRTSMQKKMERPALKRQAVEYAVQNYGISRRRACRITKQHRSMQYYRSRKDPRTALRARMRELAQTRVRYGYRRLHVLLRHEGWSLGSGVSALHGGTPRFGSKRSAS